MRTVLIVGEAAARVGLESTMLQRSDIQIITVGIESALETAKVSRPDLVIVDPNATGSEPPAAIIAALRAQGSSAPRVLMLASPAEQDGIAEDAADGFVSRPITTSRLLDAVRRHLAVRERGEARAPFAAKVDVSRAGVHSSGYAHDLTSAGMFLVTREPLTTGEEIEIEFALPPPEPHTIRTRAQVVRAGNAGAPAHRVEGFGLAFTQLSGEQRIEIARWIRQREHA